MSKKLKSAEANRAYVKLDVLHEKIEDYRTTSMIEMWIMMYKFRLTDRGMSFRISALCYTGNLIDGKSISSEMRPYCSTMLSTRTGKTSISNESNGLVTQPEGTSLDPSWSELELYLSGDEFLRCDLKECVFQLYIGFENP
ncbi:hypothetical protein Tco_1294907 [Tanacetum coccineum]